MSISVAIVEDDAGIRESLAALLKGNAGFRPAGIYGSAEEALREMAAGAAGARVRASSTTPGNPHPEVVLLDINLPGMSGIECVGRLKAIVPQAQILMLTVYDDSELIFDALTRGASGYITKRTAPAKLLEAIRDAHEGGAPMSPHIARKVVQFFQRPGADRQSTGDLTDRERQVLEQLARGYLYKEIGDALGIGVETVRRHLTNIYAKLHVHTRTEATVKYLQSHPTKDLGK